MKIFILLATTFLFTSCGVFPETIPVEIKYSTCDGKPYSFSGMYQGNVSICSSGCIVGAEKDLIILNNGMWDIVASNVCSIQLIK